MSTASPGPTDRTERVGPGRSGRHTEAPDLAWRGSLDDGELAALHAAAFDHPIEPEPWTERLERYSLGWVTARRNDALIGFCNVITDDGRAAQALTLSAARAPGTAGSSTASSWSCSTG